MPILPQLYKFVSPLFSPAGPSARLTILIYHRVLDTPDPMQQGVDIVDDKLFDWQLSILQKFFNPLPLNEAIDRLKSGTLPSRAICITFDDGYADNFSVALPILKKYNMHSTFFIATSFLDGGIMWNDIIIESLRNTSMRQLDVRDISLGVYDITNWEQKNLAKTKLLSALKYNKPDKRLELINHIVEKLNVEVPHNLMMTTNQIRELHQQGMEIGGHTMEHPILSKIDTQEAAHEITSGKKQLEKIINNEVTLFAYPNGKPNQDYDKSHANLVMQAGFKGAVSTSYGVADKNTDVFQLPRFTPWDRSQLKFVLRMSKNYFEPAVFAF